MTRQDHTTTDPRHGFATRLLHAGLAISIIVQLLTSLVMQGPSNTDSGDQLFQIHHYAGLIAMALAFLFWLTIVFRRGGTDFGALIPWLSPARRKAFFDDLLMHLRLALRFRLPPYEEEGPLASGIHGLGLLLISAMALSGTIYALQVWVGHSAEPDGVLVMQVHFALANLVWAYLIGHAAMATLHHITRSAHLARMWSLSR